MEANLEIILVQANRDFYEKDGLFYDTLTTVNKMETLIGVSCRKFFLNSKCIFL